MSMICFCPDPKIYSNALQETVSEVSSNMIDEQRRVADIMASEVKTVGRNDKLSSADDVMKQDRIRHLPVLDQDGNLCGIVSQRDLFRGMLLRTLGYGTHLEQKLLDTHVIKEAMIDQVHTTTADTSLKEAARLMTTHKVGCLPVVDDNKLVGIITEEDFVKLFVPAAG